ncbi:MAG: hypothetical protein R3E93_05795 [Thiothrix sp.]
MMLRSRPLLSAANRGGVRAILDQLRDHQALQAAKEWQREQFKRENSRCFKRCIGHGTPTGG